MISYSPSKKKISMKISKMRTYQVDPEGTMKKAWDFTIVILLLYTATYAPYRTAFMEDSFSQMYFAFELAVDGLFFIDIILSFLTPYQIRDGEFEYSSKKIAQNYIIGPFPIDIIAIMPTWAFEESDASGTGDTNRLVRLARLQRLYRLLRIFRVVKLFKINKYNDSIQKLIDKFKLERSTSRILLILVGAMFLVHLFACFFYLCAKMNDFASDTFVVQRGDLDLPPIANWCRCVYWAF